VSEADLTQIAIATPEEEAKFPFEETTVMINGKEFRFRELSVQENDECADASREEDGAINGRTMMRMMIMASSVNPRLELEDIAKMPQRMYIRLYDTVTRLNTVDFSDEGKG
jgi:hypothetical protein